MPRRTSVPERAEIASPYAQLCSSAHYTASSVDANRGAAFLLDVILYFVFRDLLGARYAALCFF